MEKITVSTIVYAPLEKVWEYWNTPEHITQWAFASDEWHAPKANNDLRVGGVFSTTMAAKDGSASFDFSGTYTAVVPHEMIAYVMEDGREVTVIFKEENEGIVVTETFDPEHENSRELQQDGWQAILNNFKKHVERS